MRKRITQSLALALAFLLAVAVLIAAGWLEGFSGLVILFFLGYCAIIVVCQVLAAMIALRREIEAMTKEKEVSRRVSIR